MRKAVDSGEHSRTSLAHGLCEVEDWRNAAGELCLASARKVLPRLADSLGLVLPASRPRPDNDHPLHAYPDIALSVGLQELGDVRVELVAPGDVKLWRSMMASHHPQGEGRQPGARLLYWVVSSRHGRLGGLSFCAASWHQQARDGYIGWTPRERAAHLGRIVNNGRFLILPGVRIPSLASHALGLALSRLADDWHAAYGVRPTLAYTYVDAGHAGTCYAATGWDRCEKTTVRGRSVWMKPLCADWRNTLCAPTRRELGTAPPLSEIADWAAMEYGRSTMPDGRLRTRLVDMGRRWEESPGAPVCAIFPQRAEQKAAYRFLSNGQVTMDDILEPHREALTERCRLESTVLVAQDTTTLNYTSRRHRTGDLVKIGGGGRGLMVHASLAFTESGRPLGVLALDADARKPADELSEASEEKESIRWFDGLAAAQELGRACGSARGRVVNVCDREADIYDLFKAQAAAPDEAGLLVRANRGRQHRVAHGEAMPGLWEHMEKLSPCAARTVRIAARGGQHARKKRAARIELRIARVALCAPGGSGETLEATAVSATEPSPPKNGQALSWMLLCSEGEATTENALRILAWYERRWGIEEFFRVLKTGTRVEDRSFDEAGDLKRCLAFDAITAWRVFDLDRMAREKPDAPAFEALPADEIEALYILLLHQRIIPKRPPKPPDIRTVVTDIARLVGFWPTKRQPLPGNEKLWNGYVKLKQSYLMYRAFRDAESNLGG